MTMQWQNVSLPFVGGIDSKSDDKALQPPKLTVLENGVFTKRGAIVKRLGYADLGVETSATTPVEIADARALDTLDDELLMFDDGKVYSYTEPTNTWADKGALESVVTTTAAVAKATSEQTMADFAVSSDVAVYAWEDSRGGVRFSVVNTTTGAVYANDTLLSSGGSQPRCVVTAGFIHIVFCHVADTKLQTLRISPADVPGSLAGAVVDIATNLRAAVPLFDAETVGSRALLAYAVTGNTINVGYLTSAGSLTSVVGIAENPEHALAVAVHQTTGNVAVVCANTANGVRIRLLTPGLSVALGPAAIVAGVADCPNLTACWERDITSNLYLVRVFWERTAAATYNHVVWSGSYTTNATLTAGAVLRRHSALSSRAFLDENTVYVHVGHVSTLQSTYFTLRYDGVVIAKFLQGTAGGLTDAPHLPQVQNTDGRAWAWAGIYKRRLSSDATVYTEKGVARLGIDFDHSQSHRAVQIGQSLYVTGGLLWMYDGQGAVESGFHLFPENVTSASSNGTGSMTSGVSYTYRVYWEWVNAKGELEQSTSAAAVTQAMGAADDTVTLTIRTLAHTAKRSPRTPIRVAVYRTAADPFGDSPFFRASSLDPTATGNNGYLENDPTADTVTFVDGMTDATLITKQLDYQNTGELDNVAPPAPSVMVGGKGRVFLAGFEQPNLIIYSKLNFFGAALAFNDALTLEVDPDGGPIAALGVLDDKLVIFKESRVFALIGDGPNNLGGGEFSAAQLVTSDAGCTNQRSVVSVPAGLMFQTAKGVYLLDRSLQLSYVGADVEAYNEQTITAATLIADRNQVVFLTDDGAALLYDYFFNQWSTFTAHEGVGAVVWRGAYAYLRGDAVTRVQTAGLYTDGLVSYPLKMETAWVKLRGLQGFQRVRRAHVLGEFKSTHTLRFSVGYDYEPGYDAVALFDPSAAMDADAYGDGVYGSGVYGGEGSAVYQFRASLPKQKCQAVRFRFEDVPGDDPGESYEITELALEIGIKPTPFKLGSGKTVTAQ